MLNNFVRGRGSAAVPSNNSQCRGPVVGPRSGRGRSRKGSAFWIALVLYCAIFSHASSGQDDPAAVEKAIRRSFQAEAEGRIDAALTAVAETESSTHPLCKYRAGKILMRQARMEEALVALSESVVGDPTQEGLLSHTAFVLRALGRSAEARRTLRAAAAIDPRDLWIAPQLAAIRDDGLPLTAVELSHISRRRLKRSPVPSEAAAGGWSSGVVVTAANSLYFGCVGNLVGSVQRHEPGMSIDLYDLGLNPMEREAARSWAGVTLRTLAWDELPGHVRNIRNKAWKPFVLQDAMSRHPAFAFQDAGQEVRRPLEEVRRLVERDGYMFVVQNEKALPKMVHPTTLTQLGVGDPRAVQGFDMCAAGILGLANASAAARSVVRELVRCAGARDCIAPGGASVANHRFEQAALSVILARAHLRCHNTWALYAYLEDDEADAATVSAEAP